MKTIKDFIAHHPILTYYLLTFAISWSGIILVMSLSGGIPATREQFARQFPFAVLAMLVGPGTSGLLLTGLLDGRAGFRALLSRLTRWRAGIGWYAVALLTGPVVLLVVLLALSLASPVYFPGLLAAGDKMSRLLSGLVAGVVVGVLEEVGWTGFAVHRLRSRHSILKTGLIVGVLWGAWHIMGQVVMASGTYTGGLSLPAFLITGSIGLLIGQLPAFRILMVWVYDRTGSLLLAVLLHLSLTAGSMMFEPLSISGVPLLLYGLVTAAVMWAVAVTVTLMSGRHRLEKPSAKGGKDSRAGLQAGPPIKNRQRPWQRITLLSILGYEGAGALAGGILLVAAPDGRLMDMPVVILHNVFANFLIPGVILTGLGILTTIAFVVVLRRAWTDWLFAGLSLGGLLIWFIVEIAILQELHWLHAMWGLPVLAGCLVALPLIPFFRDIRSHPRRRRVKIG